jgi:drug/metabolite transporter (DMT)-like permease
VLIGSAAFAVNDAVVKTLGFSFHATQMGFFRYFFGFLILVPWFARHGLSTFQTRRPWLHAARAVIAGIGQVGAYYAVVELILADATAIAFSRVLFLTVLAVIVLGETVGWRRWTATGVGFLGVVVMVRPGAHGVDPVALFAVVAAILFAVGLILVRIMAATEPAHRILFYYHIGGALLLLAPAAWYWRTPSPVEWAMLFLISALTTFGMVCFIRGFMVGDASVLGPMEYVRLVYAASIGYFLFSELPDLWTGVGAAVIVGSTLYIAQREAAEARAKGARLRAKAG